jgi:hypothetical protein
MEKWRHGDMRHGRGDMETSNRKWRKEAWAIFLNPFAHCANGSLSFVRLLAKKQTEVICKQTEVFR